MSRLLEEMKSRHKELVKEAFIMPLLGAGLKVTQKVLGTVVKNPWRALNVAGNVSEVGTGMSRMGNATRSGKSLGMAASSNIPFKG